jgi:hypothetical protein
MLSTGRMGLDIGKIDFVVGSGNKATILTAIEGGGVSAPLSREFTSSKCL